jgi:aspartyl-tRNA(Asn)/glutamyl-tRNA(Gln) amidotransferase subunit C
MPSVVIGLHADRSLGGVFRRLEDGAHEAPTVGCHPVIRRRYHREMVAISRETVVHVAHLAQLHLSDEEIDRVREQLSKILDAIETLADVDTSHVGPTASVISLENVMREDAVGPGLPREAALANAPLRDDPFLRVPTVLEEGR